MVWGPNPFGFLPSGYLALSQGFTAEYVEAGQGEPLVLLPGLAGGIDLLEPLIDELKQSFRVIAIQLRGERGRATFDRFFDFDRLVDDLDEVITGLHLERPGLLGVSFGGAIALKYALKARGRSAFVAVQGTSGHYEPGLAGHVMRAVLHRVELPHDNPHVNQFLSVLIGNRRRAGDQFEFVADRIWRTDQAVMAHRLRLLDQYDLETQLSGLATPTLVMGGDQDYVVHSRESEQLAKALPRADYRLIGGSGHLAHVTHCQQMAEQVSKFSRAVA